MSKKKKREEIQPVIPKEEADKNVISLEDVEDVVSGDERALSEQIERVRDLTKESPGSSENQVSKDPVVSADQQKQPVIAAEKKASQDAQLMAQKKAEEEKLKQQQLAIHQRELEEKKREQQALEAKRQEEQEILKKQEEERKKLEQQRIINQQTGSKGIPPQTNQTIVSQQNISTNNTQPVASNNTIGPPPAVSESDSLNAGNDKGGPSTFKRVMAGILFILLMAMVYFLPEITSYMNDMNDKSKHEKITSGVMECNLKKSNKKLDITIKALFHFTNSQLYKMEYTTVHTGDKIDDKTDLEKLYDDCLTLKQEAGELDGVTISCSLNNGVNSNRQILDYEKLDLKEVTSAYIEAGGIYPAEFKKSENIDKIESEMTANNYVCNRR